MLLKTFVVLGIPFIFLQIYIFVTNIGSIQASHSETKLSSEKSYVMMMYVEKFRVHLKTQMLANFGQSFRNNKFLSNASSLEEQYKLLVDL